MKRSKILQRISAEIAQVSERQDFNPKFAGSIQLCAIIFSFCNVRFVALSLQLNTHNQNIEQSQIQLTDLRQGLDSLVYL